VTCQICRKISAATQVSTLLPDCSDAGLTGPVAWNWRAGSPRSLGPWQEKGALTRQLEKRDKTSASGGDFSQA